MKASSIQSLNKRVRFILVGTACSLLAANLASALSVTTTTSSASLSAALGGGGGLTVTSATVLNGASSHFRTYAGVSLGPVTIGNGIVLSTGLASQTTAAFTDPSTDTGAGGTAEFNAYGPGRIANFTSSNNVASLEVSFTLTVASQVGFDFVFGSV